MSKKIVIKYNDKDISTKVPKNTGAVEVAHIFSILLVDTIKRYGIAEDKKDFLKSLGQYYDEAK